MKLIREIRHFVAIGLMLVFLNPQLVAPLHLAVVSHDHKPVESGSKASELKHEESKCLYCDFHFFHFLADVDLSQSVFIRITEIKTNCPFTKFWQGKTTDRFYSGRAPPCSNCHPDSIIITTIS